MADSVFHVGGIEGRIASNAQAITSNTQAIAKLNRAETTATDFNSLVCDTSGADAGKDKFYKGSSVSAMSNKPSDETNAYPFILDASLYPGGTYCVQRLVVYGPNDNVHEYVRNQHWTSSGTVWGAWQQIATLKTGTTYVNLNETISSGTFTRTGITSALTGVNHIYSVIPVSPASNWVFSSAIVGNNKIRLSANGAADIAVYYIYD